MRIAVCFYGQVRTAKYASNNLKRYFGKLINHIDFFTHTWNIKMDRPLNMLRTTFNEPVRIDNSVIDDYKKTYEHKIFLEEDQIAFRSMLEKKGRPTEMAYPYYSFYQAIQNKKKHEQDNCFKYNIVIKLRPDIIFPTDRSLQQDIDEFLTDPEKIHICYHDDVFHIGNSKNMDIAADFYVSAQSLHNSLGLPFDEFTAYISKRGIHIKQIEDRRFTVLRNELVHLDSNNQYHEICYLNSVLYSELFYHLRCSWKWWYNTRNPNWRDDMYRELSKMLHPEDFKIILDNHVIDI